MPLIYTLGYERVYLPLTVADIPFHIQGNARYIPYLVFLPEHRMSGEPGRQHAGELRLRAEIHAQPGDHRDVHG